MFPCESDATVNLDVHLRIAVAGMRCSGRCHCRGVGELFAAGRSSTGRVPNFSSCDFRFNKHVGAVMLHRLEHGDCSTELLTLAGVVGRHVGGCAGNASRFSGQKESCVINKRLSAAGNDDRLSIVERDLCAATGWVEVGHRATVDAICCCVHDREVVSNRDDDEVCQCCAEHATSGAGDGVGLGGKCVAESDSSHHGSVSETRKQLGGNIGWGGSNNRGACDDGGHERAGSKSRSHLLNHDNKLGHSETGTTVLFWNVKTEPSEFGKSGPEGGHCLFLGFEQFASGVA